MCHHFVVSVGSFLGPVIIQPFLPEAAGLKTTAICNVGPQEEFVGSEGSATNLDVPFCLLAVGHVFCGLGYVVVMALPWSMPGV